MQPHNGGAVRSYPCLQHHWYLLLRGSVVVKMLTGIVECFDPKDLFASVKPLLNRHLPLHNLHWKSTIRSGNLRTIDTLNVLLTKSDNNEQRTSSPRRHQIPGLHQTPVVKLYLLRCDDKAAYKETERKQLRSWVKDIHLLSTRKISRSQKEKHNAFEWMIIHLVFPDTPAANQGRDPKTVVLGSTDSSDSVSTAKKWPGKSPSTLYDKLRADFDGSSKGDLSHVAQIRHEQTVETEEQWQDLIEKLKSAILRAFDSRVSQFEADIKDREAQRSLPGWNFCTFFLLKEGLAQAFENIGLWKDAQALYDELSLDLETIVQETHQTGIDQEGWLLPYSRDLKGKIRRALNELYQDGIHQESRHLQQRGAALTWRELITDAKDRFPFGSLSDLRDRILANEVSAFDLRVYLYLRQVEVLHVQTSKERSVTSSPSVTTSDHQIDLISNIAAQMCQKGSYFINLGARNITSELYVAWGGQAGTNDEDLRIQHRVIHNLVLTWKWCAAIEILSLTETMLQNEKHAPRDDIGESVDGVNNGNRSPRSQDVHKSSLDLPSDHSTAELGELSEINGATTGAKTTPGAADPVVSSRDLAFWRGQLLLQLREIISELAPASRAANVVHDLTVNPDRQSNADLKYAQERHEDSSANVIYDLSTVSAGLSQDLLQEAVLSALTRSWLLQSISLIALSCFSYTRSVNIARRLLCELGAWKAEQHDYPDAVKYFERARLVAIRSSTLIPDPYETIYIKCLKHLEQHEAFVQYTFAKLAQERVTIVGEQDQFDEAFRVAEKMDHHVDIDLCQILNVVNCTTTIGTASRFNIKLSLETKSNHNMPTLDSVDMRLQAKDDVEIAQLHFVSHGSISISAHTCEVTLVAPVEASGLYRPCLLEVRIGKVRLTCDLTTLSMFRRDIMVYPSPSAPSITACEAMFRDLAATPCVAVKIAFGIVPLYPLTLKLKPATAGLRLHLHQTRLGAQDEAVVNVVGQPPVIHITPRQSSIVLDIPYTFENLDGSELVIKLVASYKFDDQEVMMYQTLRSNSILPITVNVHDIFKRTGLFSLFTLAPATLIPLRLVRCHISGVADSVNESAAVFEEVDVLPKQAANWLCHFSEEYWKATNIQEQRPRLFVTFQRYDEVILDSLKEQLRHDLQESEWGHLFNPLSDHLFRIYQDRWSEQDLETACLLQEIALWPYDLLHWPIVVQGLAVEIQRPLLAWLELWHRKHESIALRLRNLVDRTISIPVDFPAPKMLVVLSLTLLEAKGMSVLTLGKCYRCKLSVSIQGSPEMNLNQVPIGAFYEIHASPDTWIIGGKRKGALSLAVGGSTTIPLLLLPQRTGRLLLPQAEVKTYQADQNGFGRTDAFPAVASRLEAEYHSQATSVMVSSSARITSVATISDQHENDSSTLLSGRDHAE